MSKQAGKGLVEQDLATMDPSKLHPLSPEVISRQATINIGAYSHALALVLHPLQLLKGGGSTGTIGHVAHGKSTVVKAISGVQASSE